MNKIIEQRVCLKFCVVNGTSCAHALKMLEKAYGDSVLSKTRVHEWYKAFQEGCDIVEVMTHSEPPLISTTELNVNAVKEMVLENPDTSLREIVNFLNIAHESVRTILMEHLDMRQLLHSLFQKS